MPRGLRSPILLWANSPGMEGMTFGKCDCGGAGVALAAAGCIGKTVCLPCAQRFAERYGLELPALNV